MANLSILWRKPTDTGTYSAGSWVAPLPLANVANDDVKRVARSTDALKTSTQFCVDCGTTPRQAFSMFAFLNHNATTQALVRFVVTNSPTDVVEERIYDSGLEKVWKPTVIFGSLPWGVIPWDGVRDADYPGGTICFHMAPETFYGQYVFVYIEDETNSDDYIEIGRFLAGAAWTPEMNMSYGASIRIVDPSEVRRTRGGRKVVRELPKYRVLDIQLEDQSEADAFGGVFEIQQQEGLSGNFLVIYNSADTPSILFRRAFYGSLAEHSPIAQTYFDKYSTRLVIEELI